MIEPAGAESKMIFVKNRKQTAIEAALGKDGVVDGTRTRNIQNHNLGLYH